MGMNTQGLYIELNKNSNGQELRLCTLLKWSLAVSLAVLGGGLLAAEVHSGKKNVSDDLMLPRDPSGSIDLQSALFLTLMKNPKMLAYDFEVRAAEARELQSGLWPNPELEAEAEDFGGSGERAGFKGVETSVSISQLIELGGKRGKRKQVAQLSKRLHEWDYEAKKLDVFTNTSMAFIDVLAQQRRLSISREMLELTEEIAKLVSEKVEAGKVSPLEKNKADILLATTRISEESASRSLQVVKRSLAAQWGDSSARFTEVDGDLDNVSEIPPLESLIAQLEQNPDIRRFGTELQLRESEINLAKSSRIPDVTVRGGVKRYEETSDYAFVVGVSIPLGIFDRNQGGIQEAKHNLGTTQSLRNSQAIMVESDLVSTYQYLAASYYQALTLKNTVIPAALSAVEAASEGYRLGKQEYLDVLDAQRTLFDLQGQYVESLVTYHKAVIKMERLIGKKINKEIAHAG